MRIKCLAQGHNILMPGFEPSNRNRHSNHMAIIILRCSGSNQDVHKYWMAMNSFISFGSVQKQQALIHVCKECNTILQLIKHYKIARLVRIKRWCLNKKQSIVLLVFWLMIVYVFRECREMGYLLIRYSGRSSLNLSTLHYKALKAINVQESSTESRTHTARLLT